MSIREGFHKLALSVALSVGTMAGGSATAQDLRFATVYPPGSTSDLVTKVYAKKLGEYTNNEVSVKLYPMSLLSAAEVSDGVRDGIADIGYLVTAYFPSLYPHSNLLNESSMQLQLFDNEKLQGGKDAMAFNGAMSEFIFFHCVECNDEYKRQNQVYTGNLTSSRYALLCNKPVKSMQDLQGLRMRVAGSHWSRWARAFGGESLSLTVNEVLEAMDQGILDCNIQSAPELINLSLWEVVTDITMAIPGGVYAGGTGASVNADVWRSLPLEHRQALLRAGADLSAGMTYGYVQQEQKALQRTLEHGATLHEADESLVEASRNFAREDLKTIVDYYAEKHGVERGQEILDQFRPLLDKWLTLVNSVESEHELSQLYWDEIYSKVDTNKYGL